MDTYVAYAIIILLTTDLWRASHSDLVRESRVASDFDEDPLSRKIVPKSVFITPSFGCPWGYAIGDTGECLNIVRISSYNQYEFILARITSNLNANREFYMRSKKDILQESETTTTTTTESPSTTKTSLYYNVRPKKQKHRINENTEGPLRISIPINWKK